MALLNPGSGSSAQKGWIEIICGCMFSGKTEELIRRISDARMNNLTTSMFKPSIDKRYHHAEVVSHNAKRIPAVPIESPQEILRLAGNAEVIGIDEVQFFEDEIVAVCETLAAKGVRLVLTGLDTDYLGRPFGPVPALIEVANEVTMLSAHCSVCGEPATNTYRKVAGNQLILTGEKDLYEARCRPCFEKK